MKPSHTLVDGGWPDRRLFLKLAAGVAAAGLGGWSGCASKAIRPQSPDEGETSGTSPRLVGDVAAAFGMLPVKVEAIGLVSGLPGTGSDPAPSPQRAALLDEMQKRGVTYPNQVLASPTTELVVVQAFLRPGIQQGDRFDLEVRVPSRSEATSLRGGRLLEGRLKEMAVLDRIRAGKVLGLGEGPVLVDPAADGEADRVALTRGRILGGGVALESRKMGLLLKPGHQNVLTSARVGDAVNRRFHMFTAGVKQGVCKPKDDKYLELAVHPRYQDNIERYMFVVRSLPLLETPSQQLTRLALLERQLLDPITSSRATLRLEALGKPAVETLKKGLEASEAEVRFYAAEALAYLDDSSAVEPLAELAKDEPAFRAYALAALSAMDDFGAYDALRKLLHVSSDETRYGAFRALWAMNPHDALVAGENLAEQFSYHLLDTEGRPLIHVTRSYRPEVVLFGHDQQLATPVVLEAGKRILVNGQSPGQVTISRFVPNEPDQKRTVSNKLDEIIRAIVDLGGTYPDVVQVLQQAKSKNALPGRFKVDALPQSGRTYDRPSHEEDESGEDVDGGVVVNNPLPDLYAVGAAKPSGTGAGAGAGRSTKKGLAEEAKNAGPLKSFFGKMVGQGT